MYDLATLEEEIKEIIQAVELSFYEIGKRLELIKSNRLYEGKGYDDFQEYVAIELKIARKSAYRQIEAAQVLDEITPVMKRVSLGDTREKYLRPLTVKRLSVEDRRNIWRSVEENLPENASLNSKIVEKAVFEYRSRPKLPPLEIGTVCKVKIKGSPLKQWDGKLVRVVESLESSVKCEGFWGETIEDHFFGEELIALSIEDNYRVSVNLPVEVWEKLSKIEDSPEKAIELLVENQKY